MFMATAFAPPAAQALTIAAPAGLIKTIQETSLTQDAAYVCRSGWRRCWSTSGYTYYPYPPVFYAERQWAYYRYGIHYEYFQYIWRWR
jgi:hypothetical protein